MKFYFYSKSKDQDDLGLGIPNWRKRLSNFWIYDKTAQFPSIEHEFQAMKYLYSSNPNEINSIQWNQLTSVEAKRMGSKKEFLKRKLHLDIDKWNSDRLYNMIGLVRKRFQMDAIYRLILQTIIKKNIDLIHFSINDHYWGQSRKGNGQNYLGKILKCMKF